MRRPGTESVGGHNATSNPAEPPLCSPFLVVTDDLPDVFWDAF
jgi:hypothetical protein